MALRLSRLLVALTLAATVAQAEDVDPRQVLTDGPARVHGVTTLHKLPDGGFLTLGGSTLRRSRKGARTLEVLHRQPGDNLYRVASSEGGGVLAAWEKDPQLHYFPPGTKRHVKLPKPQAPSPEVRRFQVSFLALLPGGRDALVHMEGQRRNEVDVSVMYRVPLDRKGAPELLFDVEGARRLHLTRDAALYLMPQRPGQQTCDNRTCSPAAALLAVELTPRGVRKTVLVDGSRTPLHNARMVWGPGDERFVVELETGRNERALLRWRPGEHNAQVRAFPRYHSDEHLRALENGDVLQLVRQENRLTLRRLRPDGTEQVTTLPASTHPDDWHQTVYAVGERSDGRLWLHWADSLLLFSHDLKRTPRAYDLEPLLARRTEWGGVGIYLPDPEVLWVAIEAGRGRDFVRLSFADLERSAKPWAPYGSAAARR